MLELSSLLSDTLDEELLWDPDRLSGGWIVAKSADFAEWKAAFAELDSAGRGRISGVAAKEDLLKTQLPSEILSKYVLKSGP